MVSALRYLNNPSTIHLEYLAPPLYNTPSTGAGGGGGIGEASDEGSVTGGGGGGGGVGRKKTIIHFDLKPGNILFDEFGDVKVTGKALSHACTRILTTHVILRTNILPITHYIRYLL